jgi:eukaryotic-like serine/threonine-protein kinase
MSMSGSSEPLDRPPTTELVAGKYELVRLLGRGGMGSVWEAKHISLGTRVAIKFVEVEQAQNEEARERFQNEARAAATIQSKHAIKVHDHGLLPDGRPYIVMEMLVGEPLDKRLDVLRRLSLPDTARMVQQC